MVCRSYSGISPDRRQSAATIAGLQSAAGFLSVELGKRLRMRRTPTLTFIRDESIARGVRMATLLDEVQRKDERRDHDEA